MAEPEIELRSAQSLSLEALADLFTRSFAGYFVPIRESPHHLAERLRFDGIDLALSRVAWRGGRPVGVALLAPRGWSCRLAGMGVVTSARRSGVGRLLTARAIDDLRTRGFKRLVLEVIEANQPALGLYRGLGFRTVRRLVGFERAADAGPVQRRAPAGDVLHEMDPRDLARIVAQQAPPDLPWQLAAESLAALTPPHRAWRLEGFAYAALGDANAERLLVHSLLVPEAHRRRGWGRTFFAALTQRYPDRPWYVPVRVPEGLADGFLTALGFKRLRLTQLEMVLALEGLPGD